MRQGDVPELLREVLSAEMKITEARMEGGRLVLTASGEDVKRFVYKFKPGDYDITKAKRKRSLDANAYAWVLITKIADAMGVDKESVYRHAICETNQFEHFYVRNDCVESWQRVWSQKGLGWVVQVIDEGEEYSLCFAYYGSSAYDTAAMSKLIDGLTQDCRALEIETEPQEYVDSLLASWGKYEKHPTD